MKVLLDYIKNIFCSDIFEENCKKCSLCHLIDINSYPNLRIIEPDGNFIKKQQIIDLEYAYSKSSQLNNYEIYIIKNAEKMNKESANTMLKFIEEPNDFVIGFFITTHIENILPTIISRCQRIDAIFTNDNYENIGISEEDYNQLYEMTTNYIKLIENSNKKSIINNELLSDLEINDIKIIFKIMLSIYKGILDNKNNIEFINNSKEKIIKKINLIIKILEELNYNVNSSLLLDRFVIEMEVINNESL